MENKIKNKSHNIAVTSLSSSSSRFLKKIANSYSLGQNLLRHSKQFNFDQSQNRSEVSRASGSTLYKIITSFITMQSERCKGQ